MTTTLSAAQQRALLETQRALVRRGVHPAVAGRMVLRAASRICRCGPGSGLGCPCEAGVGKIHQTRSLRRDLDPSIPPRLEVSGEQCVRIQETPGAETALYRRLEDYRSRGWNVLEIEPTKGFPSVRVFWACPPGRVPLEAQQQVLQSKPWGAPLYAGVGAEPEQSPDVLASIKSAADAAPIRAAREAVSPWLWVFSVVGFGMSIVNYRRIGKMFRGWREKAGKKK